MPYFYHSTILDQVSNEKTKFANKIIQYWNHYKRDSNRRKNWKLICAKLFEIEVHFDALNDCLEDLKKLDSDVYYGLLEDWIDEVKEKKERKSSRNQKLLP